MPFVFFLVTVYCVIQSIRRFGNKRPPMYIQKDPNISPEQIAVWSHWNGYSLLFWAACSMFIGGAMIFYDSALRIVFYVLAALTAAGGFYFGMRGSAALRQKVEGFKKSSGSKCGKQNKKRRNSHKKGK